MAPLIEQEIVYRLLTGPFGPRLLQIAMTETPSNKIAQAIAWLRENFAQALRIEELAERAWRERLRITKGQDNLLIYGNENANDTHCKTCGSLLYSVVRDGGFVHVTLGTLLDEPTIRPSKHIFTGSKAPWFTITDDLPQYQEHVGGAGR